MKEHHDLGLSHDVATLERLFGDTSVERRRALRWLTGAGALALVGCGGGGDEASGNSSTSSSASVTVGNGTTATCSVIPEETAGPYPADGSNTANGSIANALSLSGIVRSDIRSSFAGASGTAGGAPLSLVLRLVNTHSACADLSGYAVYLWHCDREGRYSMYSSGVMNQNYLRGVQVTGSDGMVTFTTIFPGCYDGRMPHMHFEVYRDANTASAFSNALKTSQIAFPREVCSAVYAGFTGYASSVSNLSRISFATDMVFSDGVATQLALVSGDVANGYVADLTVGIAI
jgi:protocatechuate 3,4-dioxygenase beta subunit